MEYYYVVLGPMRWQRQWMIELASMATREDFHKDAELLEALQQITFLADPSTHSEMFWEHVILED